MGRRADWQPLCGVLGVVAGRRRVRQAVPPPPPRRTQPSLALPHYRPRWLLTVPTAPSCRSLPGSCQRSPHVAVVLVPTRMMAAVAAASLCWRRQMPKSRSLCSGCLFPLPHDARS